VTPLDEQGKRFASLLFARYEFVGLLGKGGFASVYKVRSAALGRFEALKVLNEARTSESDFAERFRHEARIAASLEHPSIVKVFEFGEVGGYFWYSMQLVEGPTVARELQIRGRLDAEKALRIAIPILDALDYAHVRGVVHRDVKPDNIILDEWDRAYLMDFGIAKLDDDVVKTAAGQTFGSPAYLSPEQARGLPLDGRSDVYSLGITLYQMLAGVIPFTSTDRAATVTRRLTEDPEPLSAKVPGIPPALEASVARALARDRDARYASARDMKASLEDLLDEIAPHPRAAARPRVLPSDPRALVPGAWVDAGPSSGSMPTTFESTNPPDVATTLRQTASRRAPWIAAVSVGVPLAALVLYFMTRAPASRTAPAGATAVPRMTAAGSLRPAAAPTETPAPEPTRTPAIALAPAAGPAPPVRVARGETRPHAKEAAAPHPSQPRRAKFPPDVAETAEVTLSPELAAECGGRSIGVSVVVDEAGGLKSTKVISPVSAGCDAAALDALRRYKFKPALDEEGKPIEARFSFAVRF
jgi:TonB family protein